jgi:hypothetical protein
LERKEGLFEKARNFVADLGAMKRNDEEEKKWLGGSFNDVTMLINLLKKNVDLLHN